METQSSLRDSLYGVIQPLTGLSDQNVIWDYPGGDSPPQPIPPYVTLGTTYLFALGREELSPVDSNGDQLIRQHFKWIIRVNAYGPDALGIVHSLAFQFNKDSVLSALQSEGFSFLRTCKPMRAPHLKDTSWEERAFFDLELAFRDEDTDSPGLIESVGITGEYLRAADDPNPIDSDIPPVIDIN